MLLLRQDAKTSREQVHDQMEIMNGMLCSPICEITNYHQPRRRPQTQVRRAAAPMGDYVISTSHAHPYRHCRSSGEMANDR